MQLFQIGKAFSGIVSWINEVIVIIFRTGAGFLTCYCSFLKTRIRYKKKKKLSVCFVLFESKTNKIQGYYTLSNNSIPLSSFPEQIKKTT